MGYKVISKDTIAKANTFYLNGVGYKDAWRAFFPSSNSMFYLNGVGYKVHLTSGTIKNRPGFYLNGVGYKDTYSFR